MASASGKPAKDPTAVLAGVVKYILRAASGLSEAELNNSGSAEKQGFYVGHNPQARTVLVEALGFRKASERQMLDRYKRVIDRALQSVLGPTADVHVQVASAGMVRVFGLNNEQITTLRDRYQI